MKISLPIVLLTLGLLLSACDSARPSGIEKNEDGKIQTRTEHGPWDGSLKMASSQDGLSFTGETHVIDRAGVPNLLLRENGDLVLIYQYFHEMDEALFDVIAYSVSMDGGKTWGDTTAIEFEDLPDRMGRMNKPMDPTLVETADGLRLYFTYHAKGAQYPALYSALSEDGELSSAFVVEEEPALAIDDNLLDPAVVYFDGLWHHYTWDDQSDVNYHSTSKDGIHFTLQEDISLPMDFLGQVIPFESGLLFYGTSPNGMVTAYSQDGYGWEMSAEPLKLRGADPGVAQLENGSYVMVYTSMNFNK